ncbi:alanine--tRNA ligase [Peptoniphilus stercorisuis]|uniref:Alanine--tRNA ligase n=1 Tax=Peptoniphilus stercorisuis TaxID=1436965 RepID=A0ABS4KC09_9FIRM|nr:alanine--tRNA ligase [Peptoniphilus stercorisuis]MBP2025317.1 alanyl-tRNA synthetase [Peptoniphilus stercorisuis]
MKNLKLHEIRSEFLNFFESKEHLMLPSFSLIPQNDKSLLLIGAGMAPMKKYFTGELTPPATRVTTCQKCIRTGDIENVGKTDRHATFFEMLGNFSFGDYFKKEVIPWAWEFLTEVLEIPKEDLWVTVYYEDDEAFKIWNEDIGLPKEKIVRLGKEDNFWELEVGPSGPCSEIFVDRGEKYGCGDPDCKPGCECDRFIEVWNLVFTQFDKDEDGNYNPLAHPNIDTGMGLERMATVLQGTNNIFETDAIQDIIHEIEKVSGYEYGSDKETDVSVRVIADHIRAMTFMISDSIRPSNEGRGYVLRRLIRRAARHGRILGIKEGFLSELSNLVIDSWGEDYYPELMENRDEIVSVIKAEEEKFLETIEQGMSILDSYIKNLKKELKNTLSGSDAFKLYDTYGFPVDLTEEILEEKGFNIDRKGFEENMDLQRQRARDARNDSSNIGWAAKSHDEIFEGLSSEFVGYTENSSVSKIIKIVKDAEEVSELNKGENGIIVLDKTPFYGESGGQVGDTGLIISKDFKIKVLDTKKTSSGLHIHVVEVLEGKATLTEVEATIDVKRRNDIRRNHSVTHLLHKALKEVLGSHVNQAGSEVLPNRMRFDFSHFEAISESDLRKIESRVNEMIFESLPVETVITNPKDAYKLGAVGLFEEKYGQEVRVVKMGDYSMELCGGTHVSNTSEISMFKILSEGGVSSGVRRIESITGPAVYNYLNELEELRNKASKIVKTNRVELISKLKSIVEDINSKDKLIEELKLKTAKDEVSSILENIEEVNGIKYVTYSFEGTDVNTLRDIADEIREKAGSIVVLLSTVNGDKANFVAAVSKDLVKENISAGNIVKEVAKIAGGGGGGRPDMATAGAKDISKINDALSELKNILN